MAITTADTVDRARILRRLQARNSVVAVLRALVPAFGVLAFLLLAVQLYIANIAKQYGVSGISIDRGNLVVETPQYTGSGLNGARYVVNAREARSPIGSTRFINMADATLDFFRPGQATFHGSAAAATMDTAANAVDVPGVATVTDSGGLFGTLTTVHSDFKSQLTTAAGPVNLTFPDGATLVAANMRFDGAADLWTFERSTLVIPNLPRAVPFPLPWPTTVPWLLGMGPDTDTGASP
jgi:hypothetical protein